MSSLFPGQAVVCIRDGWKLNLRPRPRVKPIKGRVYTVQRVVWCEGLTCITLPNSEPYCYEARFFRPVAMPKTSIAIFKRMLRSSKLREPVAG